MSQRRCCSGRAVLVQSIVAAAGRTHSQWTSELSAVTDILYFSASGLERADWRSILVEGVYSCLWGALSVPATKAIGASAGAEPCAAAGMT